MYVPSKYLLCLEVLFKNICSRSWSTAPGTTRERAGTNTAKAPQRGFCHKKNVLKIKA